MYSLIFITSRSVEILSSWKTTSDIRSEYIVQRNHYKLIFNSTFILSDSSRLETSVFVSRRRRRRWKRFERGRNFNNRKKEKKRKLPGSSFSPGQMSRAHITSTSSVPLLRQRPSFTSPLWPPEIREKIHANFREEKKKEILFLFFFFLSSPVYVF